MPASLMPNQPRSAFFARKDVFLKYSVTKEHLMEAVLLGEQRIFNVDGFRITAYLYNNATYVTEAKFIGGTDAATRP